jgi:2-polyprenyl-6-methoxyphenol hydroxylase-like FAD-dependent oxidoreductase
MQANRSESVLIAGAGPCGMCAAAALASQGIPVTVFEARPELPLDLRASTFHPPTLDLLDRFAGATDDLIGQGLIARTWQHRDRIAGPIATWDLGVLAGDTAHPYRLQAEQWRLTRILAERLRAWPHAQLLFGHEVIGATQTAERAELRVSTPEGERNFSGAWAIGADGANSAVRRSLGIPFNGVTLPELYLTLSTTFDFARHLAELTFVNYVADPVEWLVLLRVAATWRVLFPTRPGESRADALLDASVQRRLNAVVPSDRPYEVVHKTLYHVHERVAEDYRRGRIVLAGDAAHINNPLGGMGMNGGIHDAFNLADKLARVWRGEASAELLDRYTRQRRKMAIDFVQANALRNREALRETDPALRKQRQDEMRRIADDPVRARAFLLRSSMILALRESEQIA